VIRVLPTFAMSVTLRMVPITHVAHQVISSVIDPAARRRDRQWDGLRPKTRLVRKVEQVTASI
jgi:hypothetical protein